MQPEHRAMYVVGSTSTTRPSSSQDTPRIRVDFSPRIFESNVVARMGERSPFVSSNRKVPRSLVCTFPLVPLAGSAYAATSRITLPQAPTSDVALPLNLPESPFFLAYYALPPRLNSSRISYAGSALSDQPRHPAPPCRRCQRSS